MKEEIFCSYFLDDRETASRIYELLANDILGIGQLEKIKLRYYDMHRNFFNYSKDEAAKLEKSGQKSGQKSGIWEFSKGIEPFMPKGWNRHYEDTITVPIPITHPDFIDLTTRTVKRGAIGLDLPTWFNLKDNDRRIMIIAQDPLRGISGIPMPSSKKETMFAQTHWWHLRLDCMIKVGETRRMEAAE